VTGDTGLQSLVIYFCHNKTISRYIVATTVIRDI